MAGYSNCTTYDEVTTGIDKMPALPNKEDLIEIYSIEGSCIYKEQYGDRPTFNGRICIIRHNDKVYKVLL